MSATIRSEAAKHLSKLLTHSKELDFLRLQSVEQIHFFKQLQHNASSLQLHNSNISSIPKAWQYVIKESYPNYVNWVSSITTQESDFSGNLLSVPIKHPSLEVELLWRIHCLNPQTYYSDCMQNFGKLIPKPSPFEIEQNSTDNNVKFNTYESGFGIINENDYNPTNKTDDAFASINLWDAMHRQSKFIIKILQLTNNGDNSSMIINNHDTQIHCLNRYLQYMHMIYFQKNNLLLNWTRAEWLDKSLIDEIEYHLAKCNLSNELINNFLYNNQFVLVPAIDIDLYWHSHCLNPTSYHKFSKMLLNKNTINHNDNINVETQLNASKINNNIKSVIGKDINENAFDILKYDRICTAKAFEYLYDETFRFNAFNTNESKDDNYLYAAGCCVGISGTGARNAEPISDNHVSLGSIADTTDSNNITDSSFVQSESNPNSSSTTVDEWDSMKPDDSQGFFSSFFDSNTSDADCGACGGCGGD